MTLTITVTLRVEWTDLLLQSLREMERQTSSASENSGTNSPAEFEDAEMPDAEPQEGNVEKTSEDVTLNVPAINFDESNVREGCPQPPLHSAGGRDLYDNPNAHEPSPGRTLDGHDSQTAVLDKIGTYSDPIDQVRLARGCSTAYVARGSDQIPTNLIVGPHPEKGQYLMDGEDHVMSESP
ncbi:hypothetical protein FOXYSP1_15571 [Fusarium oxysporum f. sp. phaseoli]